MITLILVALLLAVFLNIPIAFGLLLSTVAAFYFADIPLFVLIQRMASGIMSYPLLAIPLYLLAGSIMNAGGISQKLFDLAGSFVGHVRGGLGYVNVLVSMLMAGVSGSSIADSAATSKIFVPQMAARGYDKPFAVAVTAASSIVGPVIPPSITFVIYGWLSGQSIGRLFFAGAVPGFLLGLYLLVTVYFMSRRRNYRGEGSFSWRKIFVSLKAASWVLMLPFIILGGIVGGIFTPTEAGGVAVIYALFVATFVYRTLNWQAVPRILKETAIDTGHIMLIVAAAAPFGWILGIEQVPQAIVELLTGLTTNPVVLLLILNVVMLFLGMLLETSAILIILIPILMPLVLEIGIDPIHFGVIAVINLLMGGITPPLGILMFTTCGIANVSTRDFIKEIWIFYIPLLMLLVTVTLFPGLSLWLPNALFD